MTKVLDAFLFTHEFDLLELRLRTLWPVVDKFLLMEGDHNFANKPKEMQFAEMKKRTAWGANKRFAWAEDKLIHIQHTGKFKDYVFDPADPTPYGGGELFVEHQHRQALYDYAKNTPQFEPEDILLISDVDEIPSVEIINKLKNGSGFPSPYLMHQDFYYYNIKSHRGRRWHGTMAMRFGHNLGDVGAARSKRKRMSYVDKNCGWHLAHFYSVEDIAEKLKHSSHQHYNTPEYADAAYLKDCIKMGKNYLGKKDGDLPPEPLPEYLLKEMKRFPFMLGEEWN